MAQLLATVLLSSTMAAPVGRAEQLQPKTAEAFEGYIRLRETAAERELAGGNVFLSIDALPQLDRGRAYLSLRKGQILAQHFSDCGSPHCAAIPGGLVHDWIGTVFVPGVSLSQSLAALQDYDRDAEYYKPEVLQSKLLKRSGDNFQVFLRLKRVEMVTVVLDTDYDIHYVHLDAAHACSRSYSTRIVEIENAGESTERARPVGDDRGFLWRLYSYWRFYEADGGVYIQCEAISLTRDVPAGLGWLVVPFVKDIPAESLRLTLNATRRALTKSGAGPGVSH